MPHKTTQTMRDNLSIIWTIAGKDIIDALKNRLVISMVIMLSLILLMPKMLPLIFEQPQIVLPLYDQGGSSLVTRLEKISGISLQIIDSEQEFRSTLCSGIYPMIGLRVPADFDQVLSSGGQVEFQGNVCWSKRHQISEIQPQIEAILSQALDDPATVNITVTTIYPPKEGVLFPSLVTINSVLMILMMGTFLVPSLLFEEKETRTMQALLVSPASVSQVTVGKALAGLFYILVTVVMMFTISWAEVIHWGNASLFLIGGGVFCVAVGLVLGSFFEKQQDMVGWVIILVLLLPGAVLVKMLGIELPALIDSILSWVPSVALAEICHASFSEAIPTAQVWMNLGIILVISLPLYGLVVWKINHSDR